MQPETREGRLPGIAERRGVPRGRVSCVERRAVRQRIPVQKVQHS